MGLFGHFFSRLSFLSFSLSLGDGPIWTEILSQRAVKPKTTNQPTNHRLQIEVGRYTVPKGAGREVRRCWVNFQITVGQGPIALAVGAGGVVWTYLLSSILSFLFLPLFGRRPDID